MLCNAVLTLSLTSMGLQSVECLNYLAYFSKVSFISGLSLVSVVESEGQSSQGEHM